MVVVRGCARSLVGLVLWSIGVTGCGDGQGSGSAAHERPPPPAAIAAAKGWAARVGSSPLLSDAGGGDEAKAPEVRAAVMPDGTEDSRELVPARRLVYRVTFSVPPSLRDRRRSVAAPAGELHIDASLERLRARFVGPGWPVPEGSEIRLRDDVAGAYLFDAAGGRSLGPGQLASWFEGHEHKPVEARVRIRREYRSRRALDAARDDTELQAEPGELVCALLAEWTGHPRETLAPRCQQGSLPPSFGLGPFSAELTAVVALHVPRYALRADDVDVPVLPESRSGVMLDETALARFVPAQAMPEVARGALEVANHTDARAILILQGVPVAWLAPYQTLRIEGLPSGKYRAGVVRPLGILRMTARLISVPGTLSLGRVREPEPP